jgi:methionyl-tRNA formyltransferase
MDSNVSRNIKSEGGEIMKIVFMGTPEFADNILKSIIEDGHDVVLVVTQPDKKVGRKQLLTPSPVKRLALEHQIEVYQPERLKQDYQKILDQEADLIITAAYGQMLPKALVHTNRCINVHGSLLPKYRGGAPIQHALFNGDEFTGITIMYMAQKMDSGDIILQERIDIDQKDNVETLTYKLSQLGAKLCLQVLEQISNGHYQRISQNEEEVTFAYTITEQDEFIDFNNKTKDIINRIRGLTPYPGGYAIIHGMRLKIFGLKNSDIINVDVSPGTVLSVSKHFIVKTKDGQVELTEIQVPGKKKMKAIDFLNGQTMIQANDCFERKI